MADGEKGFAKILGKRMARTKEKVLQKIGNADKTTDVEFDRIVDSFTEQQVVANHLLKEFKNYTTQVKAMSLASQSMYQAIRDSYEATWNNANRFVPATEQMVTLWDEYLAKLNDSVLPLLSNYIGKFRDVKAKVAKRERKLTDFDFSRHSVDSLENAKKRDEAKISKAHEELDAAKSVYESIHSELSEELPALYHSRVHSLCSYFGALFEAEAVFETECSKIKTSLAKLVETKAGAETPVQSQTSVQGSVSPPRPPVMNRSSNIGTEEKPVVVSEADEEQHGYITLISGSNRIDSENSDFEDHRTERNSRADVDPAASADRSARKSSSSDADAEPDREANQTANLSSSDGSSESVTKNQQQSSSHHEILSGDLTTNDKKTSEQKISGEGENEKLASGSAENKSSKDVVDRDLSSSDEEAAAVNASAEAHKYLFQVVAIHTYKAEDADELSFEKGDVIGVLPLEDTSGEQDEGWLFGVRCTTGDKGIFPLNFTSRL